MAGDLGDHGQGDDRGQARGAEEHSPGGQEGRPATGPQPAGRRGEDRRQQQGGECRHDSGAQPVGHEARQPHGSDHDEEAPAELGGVLEPMGDLLGRSSRLTRRQGERRLEAGAGAGVGTPVPSMSTSWKPWRVHGMWRACGVQVEAAEGSPGRTPARILWISGLAEVGKPLAGA